MTPVISCPNTLLAVWRLAQRDAFRNGPQGMDRLGVEMSIENRINDLSSSYYRNRKRSEYENSTSDLLP